MNVNNQIMGSHLEIKNDRLNRAMIKSIKNGIKRQTVQSAEDLEKNSHLRRDDLPFK